MFFNKYGKPIFKAILIRGFYGLGYNNHKDFIQTELKTITVFKNIKKESEYKYNLYATFFAIITRYFLELKTFYFFVF